MQLFSKSNNNLLAEYGESSGWVTAFYLFTSGNKEDMYTVNTFTFNDSSSAGKFAAAIQNSIDNGANNYQYNSGEKVNVKIDEANKNKVIVTFGGE
jgi:hypothetical protein